MGTLRLHHDGTLGWPSAAGRATPAPTRSATAPLLTRFGRWLADRFDAWTDDRDAMERQLAGAQNIADLENRMRAALSPRTPMDF